MRQIFLDTETTGLYPDYGHRIIEIAAVETFNRRPTGNSYHEYINPERDIDEKAQEVHGITLDFLQDKPLFEAVSDSFIKFVDGAEVVIHNAPFDVGFLNMELGRLGLKPLEESCDKITDTLKMAKDLRPGQRNNLDALCRNYGIDNSRRTLHGALLDAELLAEVYMAMTRGQDSLMMDLAHNEIVQTNDIDNKNKEPCKVLLADEKELAEHEAYLKGLENTDTPHW